MASGTMPEARATALPPDDAPALKPGAKGLFVAPYSGFSVVAPKPCSGTLVLPTTMAPASRMRATTPSSASGTKSAKSGDPKVVLIPAT